MVAIRNDSPHGPPTGSDVSAGGRCAPFHFGYAMQAGQFADPPESVVQTARLALQVTVPVGPGALLDVAQTLELPRETATATHLWRWTCPARPIRRCRGARGAGPARAVALLT